MLRIPQRAPGEPAERPHAADPLHGGPQGGRRPGRTHRPAFVTQHGDERAEQRGVGGLADDQRQPRDHAEGQQPVQHDPVVDEPEQEADQSAPPGAEAAQHPQQRHQSDEGKRADVRGWIGQGRQKPSRPRGRQGRGEAV